MIKTLIPLLVCTSLFACQTATPDPLPTPTTEASLGSSPATTRNIQDLEGCWQDVSNTSSNRFQYYTVTGDDTLDLILDINGNRRNSKVQLKPDGFLVILNQDSLGETLQWVGEQLIFKINGSQVAVFEKCA